MQWKSDTSVSLFLLPNMFMLRFTIKRKVFKQQKWIDNRKMKCVREGEVRRRKRGNCLKAVSFSFSPFLPRPHSLMGASFWTIQHWAFIIPLKWSTFRSPTYVCSFKITMAAVWIEGMIHLLRHSVTVKRNQKHQGLTVFEKWLRLVKSFFYREDSRRKKKRKNYRCSQFYDTYIYLLPFSKFYRNAVK